METTETLALKIIERLKKEKNISAKGDKPGKNMI